MDKRVEKLKQFHHAHKRMPTYAEMMNIFEYKSKAAVSYFLEKLIDEGIVVRDKAGKLIPKNFGELKVLGLVEAGFPVSAAEELLDTISLDEYLVENKEATYILKVKGDSMIDAGIVQGDMVIVERGRPAKEGEIVVAEVDGEFTLKFLRKKKGKLYLEAGNKKYKPIYPECELKIEAVVRAVIRKY